MWRKFGRSVGAVSALSLAAMSFGQAEYPGSLWAPANTGNYEAANRPETYPILYVVIHVTQGSYAGAISWFQNAASNVSAHYVVRSVDGQITQMLQHKNVGWHAGNSTYNKRSVGIEHEGFVSDPNWFTPEMYRASADLTRWITERHGIVRNRTNILGHVEVPGATHTDPGVYWNWNLYMDMMTMEAQYVSANLPTLMYPGATADVSILMQNTSDGAWTTAGNSMVRLATANPPGRVSPFFTQGNWVSPSIVTPPYLAVNSGGVAEFRFRLTAPTTPGTYTETYQLTKDTIGHFGPVVSFNIQVPGIETIYDNTDPRVSYKGAWSTGTTAVGKYGADYRYAGTVGSETAVASWNIDGLPGRAYDVYAWWSQGTNRSDQAKYRLVDGSGRKPKTVIVNQQASGGQWNYLGKVTMGSTGAEIQLSNDAPAGKVVIADAVKIVPRSH